MHIPAPPLSLRSLLPPRHANAVQLTVRIGDDGQLMFVVSPSYGLVQAQFKFSVASVRFLVITRHRHREGVSTRY